MSNIISLHKEGNHKKFLKTKGSINDWDTCSYNKDMATKYAKRLEGKGIDRKLKYLRDFGQICQEFKASKLSENISQEHIDNIFIKINNKKYAANTYNEFVRSIKYYYNVMFDHFPRPIARLNYKKNIRISSKVYTVSDIIKLLSAANY